MARRPARVITLALAALFSLAAPHALAGSTHAAKPLAGEHPAAKALEAALASGDAFRMEFVHLDAGLSRQQRALQQRAVARAMRQVRATLPQKATFARLAGLEFTLGPTDEKTVAVNARVGGEDAEHTSTFRLASQPRTQVYLLYRVTAEGAPTTLRLHALMVPVKDRWKTAGLTAFLASHKTMDAPAAVAAAQKEAAAGRHVLALALLGLANQLSRTPRYRTAGFQRTLRAAYEPVAARLGLPEDKPAAFVQLGSEKLPVHYVNARVYSRGPYLVVFREVATLLKPDVMEARQKRLAAAFLKSHPRLKQYFVGIGVSEAPTPPIGRTVRTLYLNEELEPDG